MVRGRGRREIEDFTSAVGLRWKFVCRTCQPELEVQGWVGEGESGAAVVLGGLLCLLKYLQVGSGVTSQSSGPDAHMGHRSFLQHVGFPSWQ